VQTRTRELSQSLEELLHWATWVRRFSTIDLETVLSTIVAKAVQLSGAEAGTIYVSDNDEASQKFRMRATYGMDDALIAAVKGQHIRMGETVISRAVLQRRPVQIRRAAGSFVAGLGCHPARWFPRPFDNSTARRRSDRGRAGGPAQSGGWLAIGSLLLIFSVRSPNSAAYCPTEMTWPIIIGARRPMPIAWGLDIRKALRGRLDRNFGGYVRRQQWSVYSSYASSLRLGNALSRSTRSTRRCPLF
jgi:hypothetical protein